MRRRLLLALPLAAVPSLWGASRWWLSRPAPGQAPLAGRFEEAFDDDWAEEHPSPTANPLSEDAEAVAQAGRAAWIRQMHRAPPGTDWQAIERENGLREVARHRAIATKPPDDGPRWVERGSKNQAGRMHVARPSTDGTQLYAGSAMGGVWRGTLDGEDWTPLGDDAYGGVHFLEVLPGAIHGDPDILVTASDSGIVLRSTDDGASWESPTGIPPAWWTRRLTRTADGTLFLVSCSDAVRLLRSTDAGATWTAIHDFSGFYGDVWTDGESVWVLDDGVLRVSADHGDTFTDAGVLPADADTGDLAGSAAGAPGFYAVLDNSELWRSDDAGATWSDVGALSDYWGGSLAASTVDPAFFVYGGMELHKSFDAGDTFQSQGDWWAYYSEPSDRLHADIDGIDVIPDGAGGETWYVGTDGGLFRSLDGLGTVENLSLHGLRVGQYYDVLTSSADPTHVAIGAQDQGYQVTNDVAQDDDVWETTQAQSGDYGHLTSGDGTHQYVFSVYPGFILVQQGETAPAYTYLDYPGGETSYVPWLPPIVADPEDPSVFYFPAAHLWRYRYRARQNTWVPEQWSEQSFAVASDEYVSRMEFSPVDPDRVWAATSYGRVWISDDHGVTWTMSPSMVADDNWYYGQAMAPSRTDRDTVTIGGSGYGVPSVYRSTDGGQTFRRWSQGLPDTLVYTLVEAADGSGRMFAGTETGAYERGPDDDAWVEISDATAPVTIYWDAEALTAENTIRFATYGRGVWDYQLGSDGSGCAPGTDADGDGAACDTDCDDSDASVYPGATEACDGRDVDCDPTTPAGGDADGDGDGALACDDCDDADPARFPAASERCGNGIDEDCDGQDGACAEDVGGDDDEKGPSRGGCGCATTGPSPPLAALGLLALATLRRRRKSPRRTPVLSR